MLSFTFIYIVLFVFKVLPIISKVFHFLNINPKYQSFYNSK